MKPILVINSGSSSIKYQLIDTETSNSLMQGTIERVTDHKLAFEQMLTELRKLEQQPIAIAHRVVHGGERFSAPAIIDHEVEHAIEELIPLAPLHNPGNLAGIRAGKQSFPGIAQVAVFDTAFHQSMPSSSYTYAIDQDLAKNLGIRKYGFHGSSHSFVSKSAAKFLGIEPSSFNAVILHLGNGASACAIKGGKSFDTSMGMTPLAGLVMGSRSGDIDPAVIFYLIRQGGFTAEKVDELLNKQSGLLGVSGVSDFRDLLEKAQLGDQRAKLALELFVERIRHYLGAYAARLGRLDAVVFTGGIGENSQVLRQMVCENMEILGLSIDEDMNKSKDNSPRKISRGVVPILVIPTNEELEIAMQAQLALGEK